MIEFVHSIVDPSTIGSITLSQHSHALRLAPTARHRARSFEMISALGILHDHVFTHTSST